MKNLFKNYEIVELWAIDDNTVMPIVTDSKERALEIVKERFNNETDRIYNFTERYWKYRWEDETKWRRW